MQSGEMCKIGVSKNPRKRLKDIQIGNPNTELVYESPFIFNAYEIEGIMHKTYKSNSVGREWFLIKDTDRAILVLKKIVESDGVFEATGKSNRVESVKLIDEIISEKIIKLQEKSKKIRKETLDIIEENERVIDFLYCISGIRNECDYTNLIYRTLFRKTAKELEQEYGVKPKENLRDYFTGGDLEKVQSMEMLVSSLIGCGWGYASIKTFVSENCKNQIEEERHG